MINTLAWPADFVRPTTWPLGGLLLIGHPVYCECFSPSQPVTQQRRFSSAPIGHVIIYGHSLTLPLLGEVVAGGGKILPGQFSRPFQKKFIQILLGDQVAQVTNRAS